jgi:hypothetical protein
MSVFGAIVMHGSESRLQIFNAIKALPPTLIQKHRHELIMEASCKVLQNALSSVNLTSGDGEKSTEPWKRIVDTGLRHRIFACQEAAAEVYGVYSEFTDFTELLKR